MSLNIDSITGLFSRSLDSVRSFRNEEHDLDKFNETTKTFMQSLKSEAGFNTLEGAVNGINEYLPLYMNCKNAYKDFLNGGSGTLNVNPPIPYNGDHKVTSPENLKKQNNELKEVFLETGTNLNSNLEIFLGFFHDIDELDPKYKKNILSSDSTVDLLKRLNGLHTSVYLSLGRAIEEFWERRQIFGEGFGGQIKKFCLSVLAWEESFPELKLDTDAATGSNSRDMFKNETEVIVQRIILNVFRELGCESELEGKLKFGVR